MLPPVFVAFSVTVYVPAEVYACDGLLVVDVLPSPKVQYQDVGELVDASVKATVSGADPEVGVPVNDATGAGTGVGVGTTDVTLI